MLLNTYEECCESLEQIYGFNFKPSGRKVIKSFGGTQAEDFKDSNGACEDVPRTVVGNCEK